MNVLRELVGLFLHIERAAGGLGKVANAIVTGGFHGLVSYGLTKLTGTPWISVGYYTIREVEQLGRDFAGGRIARVPWYDRVGDVVGAYVGAALAVWF